MLNSHGSTLLTMTDIYLASPTKYTILSFANCSIKNGANVTEVVCYINSHFFAGLCVSFFMFLLSKTEFLSVLINDFIASCAGISGDIPFCAGFFVAFRLWISEYRSKFTMTLRSFQLFLRWTFVPRYSSDYRMGNMHLINKITTIPLQLLKK